MEEKFCKFCGEKIPADAVICIKCGRQVENMAGKDSAPIIQCFVQLVIQCGCNGGDTSDKQR